ncbi:MAG: hypothetical protein IPJ52_02005 [Rhodocyclaceae bacterium]|nr:hypothetical protein [Rhodocyclaceae bacterium]
MPLSESACWARRAAMSASVVDLGVRVHLQGKGEEGFETALAYRFQSLFREFPDVAPGGSQAVIQDGAEGRRAIGAAIGAGHQDTHMPHFRQGQFAHLPQHLVVANFALNSSGKFISTKKWFGTAPST